MTVAALGLMDHDGESSTVAYASLIQTFNRFLIDQMTAEADSPGRNPALLKSTSSLRSPLTQLLATEAKTLSICQCGGQTSRDSTLSVVDMIYPRRVCFFFFLLALQELNQNPCRRPCRMK
jgi:PAB-dependent poly(A)-specific ribonuclease subunit 2